MCLCLCLCVLQADEYESGFHEEREARTKDKFSYESKIGQMKADIENLKMALKNMTSKNESLARDKKHLMEQFSPFQSMGADTTASPTWLNN